jgi:hypothetical protein
MCSWICQEEGLIMGGEMVFAGGSVNIRGPSMYTAGFIGLMGGFMYAYQCSAGRLMGMFPNDDEVARYKR